MDIKKAFVMSLALAGTTYLAMKQNGTMSNAEMKIEPTVMKPDTPYKMVSTPVSEGFRAITFVPK